MDNVKVNSERWLSLQDLDGEVWKPVVGYEKYYLISNYGRLKSIARKTKRSDGKYSFHKGRIVKQAIDKHGYAGFRISVECKLISVLIHRLVAMAFIPNPDNLPFINHKDENKHNNFVFVNDDGSVNFELSNLEWCTNQYNINYGTTQLRHSESLRKVLRERTYKVHQYSLNGKLINIFRGKREIVDAGFNYDAVVHCCKHVTKTACGYVWRRNNDPFEITN